jgi:hypothetical protein
VCLASLEQLERPLLRLVSRLRQTLQGLLARRVLLLGHDATLLGLHQVLARQATAGLLRRAVPHLRLRAHRLHATTILATRAAARAAHTSRVARAIVVSTTRVVVHFYILLRF